MIVIGLLLITGAVGLSLAVMLANSDALQAQAGTFVVLGYEISATAGQLLLTGAATGFLALLGLFMLLSGMGRRSRRRAIARQKMRAQRDELLGLQREKEADAKVDAAK